MHRRRLLTAIILVSSAVVLYLALRHPNTENIPPDQQKPKVMTVADNKPGTVARSSARNPSPPVGEATASTETAPPPTPEQELKAARKKSSRVYHAILDYASKHGGPFPPDLSALVAEGALTSTEAGELMRDVIDYRGASLTNKDPTRLLVMRYRIGDQTDKELRIHLGGSALVCNPTDPLPEGTPLLPNEDDSTKVPAMLLKPRPAAK